MSHDAEDIKKFVAVSIFLWFVMLVTLIVFWVMYNMAVKCSHVSCPEGERALILGNSCLCVEEIP